MVKFRKKPVVIDAIQFDGTAQSLANMAMDLKMPVELYVYSLGKYGTIIIPTLEGNHIAMVGDWIIKGVKGEFYPVKPDIFEQTYEKVE